MNIERNLFNFQLEKLEFHSSCVEGLSDFLLQEIQDFGLKVLNYNRGGVFFRGNKENLYKFFLSTRFSSRISFTLTRFSAQNAEKLYAKGIEFPWESLLTKNLSFKIESFTKDNLKHSKYALYKLKDAIKDRIRKSQKRDAYIDTENPDILLLLRSFKTEVLIQVSLTPHSLYKRGYRLKSLEAPIRETLAQALLYFSEWKPNQTLIDPMCGSGTILIEAALYLKQNGFINQSILENSYIFQKLFPYKLVTFNKNMVTGKIYGFDINPKAIQIAKENAQNAEVSDFIHFEVKDFIALKGENFPKSGHIVTNPPYGVRLSSTEELKSLYKKIGENLKQNFSNFSFTVVCGDKSLLGHFKLKAEKQKNISIAKLKGKFVKYNIHS